MPHAPDPALEPSEAQAANQELSQAMAEIYRRGWCDGTGGNFSCVLQHDPLRLLMAPSGVHKGRVQPNELIEVDGTGHVLSGQGKASAETALHLAIVEMCGAGAVLHTHSQAGTLLSQWALKNTEAVRAATGTATNPSSTDRSDSAAASSGSDGPDGHLELRDLEMLKGLEGITTHATAVQIPVLANDQNLPRLADRARPLLPAAPQGLLIAGHGLYAWGRDLSTAQRHLEILEFLLEQHWRQLLLQALTGRSASMAWSP